MDFKLIINEAANDFAASETFNELFFIYFSNKQLFIVTESEKPQRPQTFVISSVRGEDFK